MGGEKEEGKGVMEKGEKTRVKLILKRWGRKKNRKKLRRVKKKIND